MRALIAWLVAAGDDDLRADDWFVAALITLILLVLALAVLVAVEPWWTP